MKWEKKNYRISAEVFLALSQVFKDNGWDIPNETAGLEDRFNRFCERLSLFEMSEQKTIIELTKRFVVINSTEYLSVLVSLLNQLNDDASCSLISARKVFIYPLISPDDFEKTKSSKFVWYMMREEQVKYHRLLIGKELVYCEINQAGWAENIKQNEKVLLVDDYIGSGETAAGAVRWFEDAHGIRPSQIVVFTLAGQQHGINYLKSLGIEVYAFHTFQRGISDYYKDDDLITHTIIMEQIENQLRVDNAYKFGYNRSEALISLARAPNNTFPVFWKKVNKSNVVPFPRD